MRYWGAQRKPAARVCAGDHVVLELPPVRPTDVLPQDIPLDVLYEDEFIIVVNKQKGLAAHPASSCPEGTLVNALLHRYGNSLSRIGGVVRPGIVHRLDKDTSGVMGIARNNTAHQALSAQFNTRTVDKRYVAIVQGRVRDSGGVIDAPIGRHPTNRKRMAVVHRGTRRDAGTQWKLIETFQFFSLIEAHPETGRTHQIRVHFKHIGHTLAGDWLYGGHKFKPNLPPDSPVRREIQDAMDKLHGQALHARLLSINHPGTGERMTFEAPLPDDMQDFLDFLKSKEQSGSSD